MMNHRFRFWTAPFVVLWVAFAFGQKPLTELKISLPKYEVRRVRNLDYVQIPRGLILIEEEGRPEVPYYVHSIDYPKGYRVQDVVLKERSGMETATGLRLPVVILDMNARGPVEMKPGLYPNRTFTWRVVEMPDGGSRLKVTLYPFDYDPQTATATYYRNYVFAINLATTSLKLTLTTDKPAYAPGETARLRLKIENVGDKQDVTIGVSLVHGPTGEMVKKLPGKSLTVPTDTSSVTLDFPTSGIPNGDYYFDVTISSADGKVLDKEQTGLRIGIPEGKMTGFEVTPQHFKIGDTIKFSLGFQNTGSTILSGKAVCDVRVRDSVVVSKTRDFTDLNPGKSQQFTEVWSTAEAKENVLYTVVGYVTYEATATPAEKVVISTNAAPSAGFTFSPETLRAEQEVKFDASESKDPDGKVVKYQWEFGDGGKGEGANVTHRYAEPGEFAVTLTITDDGGRPATVTKTLMVSE
ncbi:MAG: PKD domain-containing protein [candidate division WOR-3 bacterium]